MTSTNLAGIWGHEIVWSVLVDCCNKIKCSACVCGRMIVNTMIEKRNLKILTGTLGREIDWFVSGPLSVDCCN